MRPFQIRIILLQIWAMLVTNALLLEPSSCDSLIYCQGQLLHTVQMAGIFADSKTFVDLKLVGTVDGTVAAFRQLLNATNGAPDTDEIVEFVFEHFEYADEFVQWTPSDFTATPKLLGRISDPAIRAFAADLVRIWPKLARNIKDEVKQSPENYSLIPVENGFIVPGGRFKEFYYWDSYWIIRGLLISDMNITVRGMLDNFVSLIDKFGFIPNGSRVYYLNRSHPPLLAMMVDEYLKFTNDTEWLKNNIRLIEKELRFWLEHRTVLVEMNGEKYFLSHYNSSSQTPRPESYLQDVRHAEICRDDAERARLFAEIKTVAESGWDFSSRWEIDGQNGSLANMSSVQAKRVAPVDLNSYLCKSFQLLADFYFLLDDVDGGIFWLEMSRRWRDSLERLLYDESDGIWYDFDLVRRERRRRYFASNFAPLWTESYRPERGGELGRRAAAYFRREGLMGLAGGIPASLTPTGEQWDYPEAWPPLQATVIFGLERSGDYDAKAIARVFAERWISANLAAFKATATMFEKYDAVHPGHYGGGGEYPVQTGFGWTNGVALELIDYYF